VQVVDLKAKKYEFNPSPKAETNIIEFIAKLRNMQVTVEISPENVSGAISKRRL
jgi:hypothetical protein